MTLLPQEIIRKKRLAQELSKAEIATFFGGYLKGDVADYQVGAMLMAIVLNGMTADETAALTLFMRDSGEVLSWQQNPSNIIDKHSTGGVGDKTSLVIMPLCVLEGLRVPMIAGRGLGHTGGTLDKLESIPGMNVFPGTQEARKLMHENGGVFMGQTGEIAPLDRRLYAMRDVTDTVESIPLITASILSKKLAEGIGGLVMDVKFGTGAFMQSKDDALKLAQSIVSVGQASGIKLRCALTDMGSPLGDRAGNALEVAECVEILQGEGPKSSRDLSVELSLEMLKLAHPELDASQMRERLAMHLKSGKAFEIFCKIIHAQGGDVRVLEDLSRLPTAKIQREVLSPRDGFVSECDTRELGLAIIELGGGRRNTTEKVNPAVGLSHLLRVGDPVKKGDRLAVIHADGMRELLLAEARLMAAYKIDGVHKPEQLIWKII